MDVALFERWLAGIALLDPAQRGRALQALALAEASDPEGCLAGQIAAPMACNVAETSGRPEPTVVPAGTTAAVNAAPAQHLLAKIGQDRIARFGCPHCGNNGVHAWGRSRGKPRYRCSRCRKTFNPLTGTPLAGLHKPERWNDQAQALMSSETVARAAARCKVDGTTAFRWRHRVLAALNFDHPRRLQGIVEADETFVLESFKGLRSGLPRAARKRGGKASKRGLSAEQIPVMVARDRSGATTDAVLPRLNAASITAALGKVIDPAAQFCCDGGSAITAFARRAGLKLHVLPAPGNPRPEAPEFHINNVNAYHGRFKEWMRRFNGVATRNLPNYLSWRRTSEALGDAATPEAWIRGAAGLGPYQQYSP
jgi:transposase-like protein